ncbi:protein of unknown function DUF1450 [Alicyclobacillus acidocaldarius subsp. acidocaldarius Tc-4-1]|uniref:DUF1450 domain-containing protein n=1 Tax=Alicyclobacillus acidocaldarius (strain Tc-4-1) TaxID=1048834 RepID=F8ICH6_ALIAT|nr:protein of unknown function DUF1450 [Alicyclobacillus acidocaldarius subsp. acidocaldarius Tc-4-1]
MREAIHRVRAERPGVTVRKYACVEQCGLCARQPFALVGGAVVEAESPECLAQRLLDAVDEAMGGTGQSRLPSP